MTNIKLYVNGAHARAQVFGELVAGTVGITIDAKFNDEWNDLSKHLVCRNGKVVKTKLDFQNGFTVAPETMISGGTLEIGFEGMSQDGKIVFPTVWATCGVVKDGANANDDYSADPTNPVWDQLEKQIGDLNKLETSAKSSIVDAVNEVANKDAKIPIATKATIGGVKAEPATEDDTQPVRIGEDGMLYTAPGNGGGEILETINEAEVEDVVMAELACNFDAYRKVAIMLDGFGTKSAGKVNAHFGYADSNTTKQICQFIGTTDDKRYGYILIDTVLGQIVYTETTNWAQAGCNLMTLQDGLSVRNYIGATKVKIIAIDSGGGGATPSATNTMMGKIKVLGVRK